MPLLANHPQRIELNDEVHARPPEAITAPTRLSFLAMYSTLEQRQREERHLAELLNATGAVPPPPGFSHYSADLGRFRIKYERHTEFSRYMFVVPGPAEAAFTVPALDAVPTAWVERIPGQIVASAHVGILAAGDGPLDHEEIAAELFAGNTLVGSTIAGGMATALTDLRIHADGFSRILVHDRGMTPRQSGRMVQRLLEIDTYRIMALLALPLARELTPFLARSEQELAAVTSTLTSAGESEEPLLLDRLTRLEAEINRSTSDTAYRFSAAGAYYELVQRRIAELREERIQGLQTFGEFTERRLAPAMNTCRAVAARQQALSERVARATQLLSTRVDITRERQNRDVLDSLNERALMQLRLQETVEGLSVAAITYYVCSLVGYAAKSAQTAGLAIDPDISVGIAIPIVAPLVWYGVRRLRKRISGSTV